MEIWRCVSEAQRRVSEEFLPEEKRHELLQESLEVKNKGNEEFERGNYSMSITLYTKALELCPLNRSTERAMFLSNRAAAYMKLFQWNLAIEDCSKAIELGPLNDKPLKRRAIAYSMSPTTLDNALRDYEALAEKYPQRIFYKERIEAVKAEIARRDESIKQGNSFETVKKTIDDICVAPTRKVLNASAQYAGLMCGSIVRRFFF